MWLKRLREPICLAQRSASDPPAKQGLRIADRSSAGSPQKGARLVGLPETAGSAYASSSFQGKISGEDRHTNGGKSPPTFMSVGPTPCYPRPSTTHPFPRSPQARKIIQAALRLTMPRKHSGEHFDFEPRSDWIRSLTRPIAALGAHYTQRPSCLKKRWLALLLRLCNYIIQFPPDSIRLIL